MSYSDEILRPFREGSDYMNDRIQTGIEANRKSVVSVKFTDAEGLPVSGVQAEIEQLSSDFKFGANIFMLEEFEKPEQNEIYKKSFAELFDLATLPFYWNDLEPEQGQLRFAKDSPKIYRRPAPDLCLEYCKAHNIEPKAHCLNYPTMSPNWLPQDVRRTKLLLVKRFRELAERYSMEIPSWEVTNETFKGAKARRNMPFYNESDLLEWSFKTAETFFPGNKLIINESSHIWEDLTKCRGRYLQQIAGLLAKNLRVDSIGMQYHMFFRRELSVERTKLFYSPAQVYEILDRYAELKRPLQITEVTIPAYSRLAEDEELQAEILKNVYSMWFSHPAMEMVIYWNLVDGFAAFAPQGDMSAGENYYHGGLLRYDFSEKPAFQMLKQLITKDWRTGKLSCESNEFGVASAKVFHGRYRIKYRYGNLAAEEIVHVEQKSPNVFEIKLDGEKK